jgi:hypothetical protein
VGVAPTSPMGKRTVTASLLVCAAVAACNLGTSEDDSQMSEAANTAARQPLLAPTWTKCWIEKDTSTTEAARQQHAVKCRYDAPGEKQPVKPQGMIVDVHFGAGSNHIEDLAQHPGQEVVVQKVAGDMFPLVINVVVYGETFRDVGLGQNWFELTSKVESPDSFTTERPFVVKQPFDLWPVVVIPKAFLAYLQLDARTFSVAPFAVGQDGPTSDATARGKILARTSEPEPSLTYFVAPKEGELKGAYKTSTGVGTSLTEIAGGGRIPGPGVYVATDTEFRKATDEEASVVGPAPTPTSSAEDASTEASTPSTDGGTEASGPPRECGEPGKKCCGGTNGGYGGTCDDGAYCFLNTNVCEACGGPGQKCCEGPNKNGYGGTCNDGSFCFLNTNVCEPCGGAGQKCCAGPNKNGYGGTCDTGSFCFLNTNVCDPCGKPGQKCCGGPNNNGYGGTCDTGATCKAGNNVCTANP